MFGTKIKIKAGSSRLLVNGGGKMEMLDYVLVIYLRKNLITPLLTVFLKN